MDIIVAVHLGHCEPITVGVAIHPPTLSLRTYRVSVAISGSPQSLSLLRDDGGKKLRSCDDEVRDIKLAKQSVYVLTLVIFAICYLQYSEKHIA